MSSTGWLQINDTVWGDTPAKQAISCVWRWALRWLVLCHSDGGLGMIAKLFVWRIGLGTVGSKRLGVVLFCLCVHIQVQYTLSLQNVMNTCSFNDLDWPGEFRWKLWCKPDFDWQWKWYSTPLRYTFRRGSLIPFPPSLPPSLLSGYAALACKVLPGVLALG